MEKYIAEYAWKSNIRKLDIERETKDSYWEKNGRRFAKVNSYEIMFDSFEEAKQFLLDRKLEEIKQSKLKTHRLSSELDLINKLKP